MDEGDISTRAYCKIIMHCAKYPSCNLNGILLTHKSDLKNGKPTKYCDAVPMCHLNTGLSLVPEIALAQISGIVSSAGLVISGFYHAHDNLKDNHVDVFSQKIADKIADNQEGAILLTLDSKRLALKIQNDGLITRHRVSDGGWKMSEKKLKLEHETITLACASALVREGIFRELVDFDNHLDDITQDYINVELNMKIDSCL